MGAYPRIVALAVAVGVLSSGGLSRADMADELFRTAADHYAHERWQAAADDFARLLAAAPDHARANQARFHYGESLVQLARYKEARGQFDELLKRDPNHRYARQALFRAGEAAWLASDRSAARSQFEAFRQRYPDDELNAYVLAHLGRLELDDGKPAAAEPMFAAGIERFKDGPLVDQCRLGLAESREALKKPEEARREYEKLVAAHSPLADHALLHLAALDNARGDHAAALGRLDQVAKDFPASPLQQKAQLGRGYALYKLARHDEAEKALEPLTKDPSLAVDAHYWLGMSQLARKTWGPAVRTFTAAGAIDAEHRLNSELAFRAAQALLQAGDYSAAGEAFDRVLVKGPASPWADDALVGKLQVLAQRSDHVQCVRLADEFAARFSDSPLKSDVEAIKGQALVALGKHAEAAASLERSLAAKSTAEKKTATAPANDPKGATEQQARAAADLAITYAKLGRWADASRTATGLLDQKPTDTSAGETVYQVAELAYAAGELATAGPLYDLLARPGNSPESLRRGLFGQGWCRFRANDWPGAAASLEQLLATFPDSPVAAEAALLRGRAIEHLSDSQGALAMYRVVIDRHAASPRVAEAIYRAARLCDKLDRHPQAIELYARLVKEHADYPQLDTAIYRWAWLSREISPQESDALFARLRRDFPKSQFVPDATLRLAERLLADKKYDEAGKLASEITVAKTPAVVREPALYLQGRIAAATGNWIAADESLGELVRTAPGGDLAPAAAYLRAESSYRRGNFEEAATRLAELSANPDARTQPFAAAAKLRQAQALVQLKRWDDALDVTRAIASDFPEFEEQYEVDYVIGRCLAAAADFAEAREAYSRAIDSPRGGKTETAAMARWMIGESYFHQENYTFALAEYEKVSAQHSFPRWQSAALLQAGKCHEMLEKWDDAVRSYERLLKEFPECELAAEATRRAAAAREHVARRTPTPKSTRAPRGGAAQAHNVS